MRLPAAVRLRRLARLLLLLLLAPPAAVPLGRHQLQALVAPPPLRTICAIAATIARRRLRYLQPRLMVATAMGLGCFHRSHPAAHQQQRHPHPFIIASYYSIIPAAMQSAAVVAAAAAKAAMAWTGTRRLPRPRLAHSQQAMASCIPTALQPALQRRRRQLLQLHRYLAPASQPAAQRMFTRICCVAPVKS